MRRLGQARMKTARVRVCFKPYFKMRGCCCVPRAGFVHRVLVARPEGLDAIINVELGSCGGAPFKCPVNQPRVYDAKHPNRKDFVLLCGLLAGAEKSPLA